MFFLLKNDKRKFEKCEKRTWQAFSIPPWVSNFDLLLHERRHPKQQMHGILIYARQKYACSSVKFPR